MRIIILSFLTFMFLLVLGGCSLKSGGGGNSGGTGTQNSSSSVVSLSFPAGTAGVSTNIGSLTISIPSGALDHNETITVIPYFYSSELAAVRGISPFPSGVQFLPDGLSFLKPVTIEIPTELPMATNSNYGIFLFNSLSNRWEQQTNSGFCFDTEIVRYQISHFCTYGVSPWTGEGLGTFGQVLETSGGDAAYAALKASILQGGAIFQMKKKVGGDTYQVCGVGFDVQYSYNGDEDQYLETVGDTSSTTTYLNYSEDRIASGGQLVYTALVTLYWKKVDLEKYKVDMTFSVTSSTFDLGGGDSTTLSGYSASLSFTVTVDPSTNGVFVIGMDPNYPALEYSPMNQSLGGWTLSTSDSDLWFQNLQCPSTLDLEDGIFGEITTAPGTSYFFIFPDDNIASVEMWSADEHGNPVYATSLYLWAILRQFTDETIENDGFPMVLSDGWSSSGSGVMYGDMGSIFNGSYTINVSKVQ